jgi:nucleoside-diphosphate-sugar epimerase
MTILVVGASGATGKLLVQQLLERGEKVRVIVRSAVTLSENITSHNNVSVIYASILDLSDIELAHHVSDCDAVVSCLGHNLTLKGMFGAPRRLVTDATRRLCNSVKENNPKVPVKFVLMNTTGNRNRDLNERISFGETCVIGLIRLLLPPHADNEEAADYLRTEIGRSDSAIEWTVVRPDSLLDETEVSEFTVHPSPTRSAIFDSGVTSRINVGCFMADLISDDQIWNEWKGQMPVIYNLAPETVLEQDV